MKKEFRTYAIFWAVLLILFNVISFVSVGWNWQEKYTASFWIGYVFIMLSFAGQLMCAFVGLKESNTRKLFYNISIIRISYSGLIASFVFGGACMLISPLPYWVAILLCSIVLALNVIALVKATMAIEEVNNMDDIIKARTFFICLRFIRKTHCQKG